MEKVQDRAFGQLKEEWPLFLLFFFMVLAYSLMCLFRHWHFESSGYDLGQYDQVIWHYSRFERPGSYVANNMLGDHFSPLLMVLAPLYWISPHVEILLVAQAFLFMLPMFPIFYFTQRRLGRLPAYCFSISFALFWGIQYAAQFDFHQECLAVPVAAFAIYFISENKRGWLWISMLLLPLVKEDMCLLVVFFGIYLIFQRYINKASLFHYWEGSILMVAGVFMFWLEVYVLIPFFKNGEAYIHWLYQDIGSGPLQALATVLLHPLRVLGALFANFKKIQTLFCMFAPFLFLPFFSPLMILALPLIGEKMLTPTAQYWGFMYHYAAVLSPVLVMAAADGLFVITKKLGENNFTTAIQKKIIPISAAILLLNIGGLVVFRPLRSLAQPSYYRLSEIDQAGMRALKVIGPDASVLAQEAIVPHLSHRSNIDGISGPVLNSLTDQYIVVCDKLNTWPLSPSEIEMIVKFGMEKGYRKVFDENGWVVLQRSI